MAPFGSQLRRPGTVIAVSLAGALVVGLCFSQPRSRGAEWLPATAIPSGSGRAPSTADYSAGAVPLISPTPQLMRHLESAPPQTLETPRVTVAASSQGTSAETESATPSLTTALTDAATTLETPRATDAAFSQGTSAATESATPSPTTALTDAATPATPATLSCSFDYYDSYFTALGSFPSAGSWTGSAWGPNDCVIHSPGTSGSGACLFDPNRTASEIVILGDSMGMRYAKGLGRALQPVAACSEAAYDELATVLPGVKVAQMDCGGCHPLRISCTKLDTGVGLHITYLPMEFVLDFEFTMPARIHWDNTCDMTSDPPCRWAWTTQQVLFDLFFARRPGGYPSQIHVVGNIHDCARRTPREFSRDLRWLLDVIDAAAPPTTHVYFWEAAALNPVHQPMAWSNITSDRCVSMMNAAVQHELRPYVQRTRAGGAAVAAGGPQWHATSGIFNASLQKIHLNYDGVHYRDEFYDAMMRVLLRSYCPSA